MIPEFRTWYNARVSPASYARFVSLLEKRCGTTIRFRVCETPAFIPASLLRTMERSGAEIIWQLLADAEYLRNARDRIPGRFLVPANSDAPEFMAVDFGIERREDGELVPRLIELQGFPTLFAYQAVLAEAFAEAYDFPDRLTSYSPDLTRDKYLSVIGSHLLGDADPAEVVLLEIDPLEQKTLPDFLLTSSVWRIPVVNIRDVQKKGARLYYKTSAGVETRIRRIYNRVIAEDLDKAGGTTGFQFNDDLDITWAGNPNWYFLLSKFGLPYIHHPAAPKTIFLSDPAAGTVDLSRFVLKPLFSFAGGGVKIHPTEADIRSIHPRKLRDYVLQEKVTYAPVIDTPRGPTKLEVRIMYVWENGPRAVNNLVRMGRGDMMGVDHNKGLDWVGSSAGFWAIDDE